MSWFRVSLEVAADDVDGVTDLLGELGAVSVTVRSVGEDEDLVVEPPPGQMPLWRRNRLLALFPLESNLTKLSRSLDDRLDAHSRASLDVGFVDDEDWLQAWRAHAVQHLFGDRLWVAPKDAHIPAGAIVLRLEPGLAFGTGGHPTTHLCLEWLAGQQVEGLQIMDYGCGSGILCIAACVLGAGRAYAFDHDPQALLATRDNATYNGIGAEQLTVQGPEEPSEQVECDVVLANILANPLIELAPRLTAMIRPGGKLVLSGLLVEQAGSVMAAYPDVTFEEPVRKETWIRLVGTKLPDVR